MKKLFIAALVTLIGLAFTAPSFAVEHEFGGYWRVRMYTQKDFTGTDTGVLDTAKADTRTRLFYTAVINDNLKFVNAFEMDADWGSATNTVTGAPSYGDIDSDAIAVEVKRTYADFNLGALNAKIGTQGTVIQRGFILDADISGVVLASNGVTAKYIKFEEDLINGDNVSDDVAGYVLSYTADLDTVKLTPTFTYLDGTGNVAAFAPSLVGLTPEIDMQVWYLGLDVDATFGNTSVWGTFIYSGGDAEAQIAGATVETDLKGWLAAAGADVKLTDMFSVHGEIFYATGDDDNDNDSEEFASIPGQSYYWSEIMGLGMFDMGAGVSNNSPGAQISNIIAANLGVSFAPMEKLNLTADLWYAALAEETTPGLDEDLGFEIDLKATYQLVDGLNLDVVGAYLFAGDSTTGNVANDENPWEVGTQLSLSF